MAAAAATSTPAGTSRPPHTPAATTSLRRKTTLVFHASSAGGGANRGKEARRIPATDQVQAHVGCGQPRHIDQRADPASGSSGGSVPSGQASPSVHIHRAGPLPPAVECVGSFSRRRSTARRKVSRCTLKPTSMRRTCAVQRPAVTVPCSRLRVGGAAVGQRPGHAGRVDTGVPEQPAGQQRSCPRRTRGSSASEQQPLAEG